MSISPTHRIVILLAAFLIAATAFMISRGSSAERAKQGGAATAAPPAPSPIRPARRTPQHAERPSARNAHLRAKVKRAPKRATASTSDAVVRAVTAGQVVVLLLYGSRGADDDAPRASVNDLPRGSGTAVFEDEVDHLARYRRVVPSGIDRTPTILVIGRNRQGRTIERHVDSGSLKQYVEDARR